MAAGTLTLGGIQYEIVAIDKTKEGIDSATRGVDSLGVHYSDTLSNIAFNFNMITQAAQTAFNLIQQGWDETIGVAERYQDQMDDMHNMFGMSIEDAQKWRAATIATDTDMGSLMITMRYLTQRVTDQSEAGDKLRSTLEGIGVSAKDVNGEWKDSSTLLQEVIVALNKIPEGSERANTAAEILGRNWYRLADMIDNADTAVKTFNETSPGITEEDSERIEKFKIKWAQLAEKIDLAKANLGLWIIESEELHAQQNSQESYLDKWLNATFGDKSRATSGAGGRGGVLGADKEAAEAVKTTREEVANLYLNLSDADREIKYQADVVIPKYAQALKEAEAAGKGVAEAQYNLATAIDRLNDLKEEDSVKAKVEAYKDYKTAIKDVADAKKSMYDLDVDYNEDMQAAGGDPSKMVGITRTYLKARRKGLEKIGMETAEANAEATEFNQISAGVPLSQIPGTTQYIEGQAKSIKTITIDKIYVTLSKDYPASDFLDDLHNDNISQGIPVSPQ